MPVDLSEIGEPFPYPAHGPRLLPWLGIWLTCCTVGVPLILLAWPASEPASGAGFWAAVIGGPQVPFLALLCIGRVSYEAAWHYARNRNKARDARLVERVRIAQKPLRVLGVGYCVPGTTDLVTIATMTTPLFKSQSPRKGAGFVVHNRFVEESWSDEPKPTIDPELEADTQADDLMDYQADEPLDNPSSEPLPRVATVVLKLVEALRPLAPTLQALSQYGPRYAPLVRVLAYPDEMALRAQQARDALRLAGLPALECTAVPETQNLMLADSWLDSRERRAVLVMTTTWHEADPPTNSSEAAVAVLLSSGFYRLPESFRALATLHRPVQEHAEAATLGDLVRNAALWGEAEPQAISRAWLTRLTGDHDRNFLDTVKQASFTGIATRDTQRRLDRVLGDAGAATAWLSLAAAIESDTAGPHLIVDQQQAAILYVHPKPLHDPSKHAENTEYNEHNEHAKQQSESA